MLTTKELRISAFNFQRYNQNNHRWPFSEYLDCIILETKVTYVDGNEGC